MLTRAMQGKKPRRSLYLLIGGTLAATGLFAAVALAFYSDTGTYDITVPANTQSAGPLTLAPSGGSVEYIGSSANNQSSGTGIFDPFVRLQGDPTEKGYNTCSQSSGATGGLCDGDVTQFDTKSGSWTHPIKVNAIPLVDCGLPDKCWEVFNDINENNTAKRVSLNVVEVWFTTNPRLTGYVDPTGFPSGASKQYEFNGHILINDVNQGSGRGDLRYLIPTTGLTWTANDYFVLYSKWGTTPASTTANYGTGNWQSEGGFEEWKVRKVPNVHITKTADAASVSAGTDIGFTITVTNTGVADATGVTISDNLPGGTGPSPVHWVESPDNANCSITGSDGSQVLSCGPVTLAAGGGSLSVHVSASTTQDNCGSYNNTATFTSTNAGSGSASASTTVTCAAIKILKQSTKTGNPLVANAGAVFAVDGPDADTTADFSVTDNGTGDEDATVGEVCVGGLQPGTYTVNETTPPSGYGAASQTNVSVVATQGTNCSSNEPTGTGVIAFTNPPLSDIHVSFRDGGSGETSATITCDNSTGTTTSPSETGWDTTKQVTGISAPVTVKCTIVIDP